MSEKKKKGTVCNICGGNAEYWDEEIVQTRMTDRGGLRQSWTTRYYQCLEQECGENYELDLDDYEEKDRSFYSASQPYG